MTPKSTCYGSEVSYRTNLKGNKKIDTKLKPISNKKVQFNERFSMKTVFEQNPDTGLYQSKESIFEVYKGKNGPKIGEARFDVAKQGVLSSGTVKRSLPLDQCDDIAAIIEIASKVKLLDANGAKGGISSAMSSGSYMSNSRMSVASESESGEPSENDLRLKEEITQKEQDYFER